MRAPGIAPLLATLLLTRCALFAPQRAEVISPGVVAVRPRRVAGEPPIVARPPPSPRSSERAEVVSKRGFRLRRSMVLGIAPVELPGVDGAFELLRRLLARGSVRALDLTRCGALRVSVGASGRERETSLEGPWEATLWASRWGGASHVLVSEGLRSAPAPSRVGVVSRGRFRLLQLPGGEAVWAAHIERHGADDAEAGARVLDGLVDALHGTLRDEPDEADGAPAPTPPRPRPTRHRHRRRHAR